MDLINESKIGNEEIEYINERVKEGLTLRQIVEAEMVEGASKEEINKAYERIKGRLKRAGYKIIDGVYQSKNEVSATENKIVEEIKNESIETKSDKVTKKKYVTKKQKEESDLEKQKKREEELKQNPYLYISADELLSNVDRVHSDLVKNDVKAVGVYLLPEVIEAFEYLEKRFSYIPSYLIVNVAVKNTSFNIKNFKNSIWLDKFSEILLTQKFKNSKEKVKKKQANYKFSQFVANVSIETIEREYPFLSKSDIVNMCMYAYSECAKVDIEELEDRINKSLETNKV